MPLTDQHKHLLHEIFEIPYEPIAVVVGEAGFAVAADLLNPFQSPTQRLLAAIVSIDADETKVSRVAQILTEYESLSLDPSRIEHHGYSLEPEKSIRLLKKRLFPYTGLFSRTAHGNQVGLG
jgi:hypothetical protein